MPNRRSDERGGGREARRTPRHLYLVLDDWKSGYSIREIDLSADCDPNYPGQQTAGAIAVEGAFCFSGKQRLPPAILRLKAARGLPMYFAAAFNWILAMQPIDPSMEATSFVPRSLVPVVDVFFRYTTFVPRPTTDPVDPIYIPAGGRLFTLSAGRSFEMLYRQPDSGEWFWRTLVEPPFDRKYVTSYALHPDGHIFVSVKTTTFTFDTAAAEHNCKWMMIRNMGMLPFTGQAHFDPELDAFVGLSMDPATIGHLCSFEAQMEEVKEKPVGLDHFGALCHSGELRVSKEKLFSEEDPMGKQVGATLVYMGGRSYFCLVQCIFDDEMNDDSELDDQDVPRFSHYSFRLTTFFLEYDKNGDLRIGSPRVRYYCVPEGVTELALKNPVAFWM